MRPRISEDSATIFWTPKLYIQLDSFFKSWLLSLITGLEYGMERWNGNGMEQ